MVYRNERREQLTKECENISDNLLRCFLKNEYGENKPIDIAKMAVSFFNLNIKYGKLSSDCSVCGIISDNNMSIEQEMNNYGRVRFTIAHECAHFVINKTLINQKDHICFDYGAKELLADIIASCLLMPKYLVDYSVEYSNLSLPITVYDNNMVKGYDYKNTKTASQLLKVSLSAFINRLKDLGQTKNGNTEIGKLIPVIA